MYRYPLRRPHKERADRELSSVVSLGHSERGFHFLLGVTDTQSPIIQCPRRGGG